jgi:hypothetical protein
MKKETKIPIEEHQKDCDFCKGIEEQRKDKIPNGVDIVELEGKYTSKGKIPKGFKDSDELFFSIKEGDIGVGDLFLSKSIYDRRMQMLIEYVLYHEHGYWEVKDTNNISKIMKGDWDDGI